MKFNLRDHTILLTLAGSRAYGIHLPDSDVDVKGICVPPPEAYCLGLQQFTSTDGAGDLSDFLGDLTKEEEEATIRDCFNRGRAVVAPEGTIYSVRKFTELALKANPNILEVLFCSDKHVRRSSISGEELRENAKIFLSKKAAYSYQGYAYSQMKRIRTHRAWLLSPSMKEPKREDYGLPPDKGTLSADEQHAFLWVLDGILKDKIGEFRLSRPTKEELLSLDLKAAAEYSVPNDTWPAIQQVTGASDAFIESMMKERAYRSAREHWKSYCKWKKTRNPKRAALEKICGYDSKHGAHLARLMLQGREIIEKGTLTVELPQDQREWILWIRQGNMPFNELEEWFAKEEKELKEKEAASSLPIKPDRDEAEALLIRIQRRYMDRC